MAQKKSAPFDSTIPVRGRKLGVVRVNTLKLCTIPVRGRKPNSAFITDMPFRTIPVRGQKNSASKKDAEFFFCKP